MEKSILEYLAEKLIEDLRKGKEFSDEIINSLNKFPYIDYICVLVTEGDIPILKKLMQSGRISGCRLGISLSRQLLKNKEIQKQLFNLWKSTNEYDIQRALMFRFLDLDDLSKDMHKEIYNFIRKNWDRWLEDQVDWYGGKENILSVCLDRIKKLSTPASKAWIYLCIATLSLEREQVKELISKYLSSPESINAKVASDLIREL